MFAVGDRVMVVGKKAKKYEGAFGVIDLDDSRIGGWVWTVFPIVGRKAFTPDELAKVKVTVLEGDCDEMLKSQVWYKMNEYPGEHLRITIERVVKEG